MPIQNQETSILLPCPSATPPYTPTQFFPPGMTVVVPLSDGSITPYSEKLGYTYSERTPSYHGLDSVDRMVIPILEVPKGGAVRVGGNRNGNQKKAKKRKKTMADDDDATGSAAASSAGISSSTKDDDVQVTIKTRKFGFHSLSLSSYVALALTLSSGGGWMMPFAWHDNTRRRIGEIVKYLDSAKTKPTLVPVWDELEGGKGDRRWLVDYFRTSSCLEAVEGFVVVSETPVSEAFVNILRSLKPGVKVYCPYLKTVEDVLEMAVLGVGVGVGCCLEEIERGVAFNIEKENSGKFKVQHFDLTDEKIRMDKEPLSATCGCLACREPRRHSKGYLHHLWKTGEITGKVLAMNHCLWQCAKLSCKESSS